MYWALSGTFLYIVSHLIHQCYKVVTIITYIGQMRKLRLSEYRQLDHDHIVSDNDMTPF